MISALQRGTRTPRKEQVEALDAALGSGGALLRLWASLIDSSWELPTWFRQVAVLEQQAKEIIEYQPLLIPGLLQTENYARAVSSENALAPVTDIAAVVRSRTERLERLWSGVLLRFVIDEDVIRANIGGAKVMAGQLRSLLTLIESHRARISILPADLAPHPARTPPFRVMSFTDRPKLGYVEHALGGELIDDSAKVGKLEVQIGALAQEALPTAASAALLRKVATEFDGQT